MDKLQDIEVVVSSSLPDGTEVATAIDYGERINAWEDEVLVSAIQKYDSNKMMYSAYQKDSNTAETVTLDILEDIATDVHSNIDKVLRLNAIIREEIVLNGLLGRAVSSVISNTNSDYRLYFPEDVQGRNKQKTLEQAKIVINDFISQINLNEFIHDAIIGTYTEGNSIYYLKIDGGNYTIDKLMLGVAYPSDYMINNRVAVQMDLKKLENGLKKTYQKTKKRKEIWMKDVDQDIKVNFPYVYNDWKSGETYARLDPQYAKVIRIGNLGRKFGVSPIASALSDVIVANNIKKADMTTSKMKQRIILLQTLNKEVLGPDAKRKSYAEAAFAHSQLMDALSTTSSVYTASAAVKDVSYVEPKGENTNDDKLSQYNRNILTSLGIGFSSLDTSTSASAVLNLAELMKSINAVARSIDTVLNDWFKTVLINDGIDVAYAPCIEVCDSKAMSIDLKKDLASFVYTTLNGSTQTAVELIGLDYQTEKMRREAENEAGISEIFAPHGTAYTQSGGGEAGRPADKDSNDPGRQSNDKIRNETK